MRSEENARLVIERSGHQVAIDGQGLTIDGERICKTPLTPAQVVPPGKGLEARTFGISDAGEVVYRGRMVAEIGPAPVGTANPGSLTIHGPSGPEWHPADGGPSAPELAAAVRHATHLATRRTTAREAEAEQVTAPVLPIRHLSSHDPETMEITR